MVGGELYDHISTFTIVLPLQQNSKSRNVSEHKEFHHLLLQRVNYYPWEYWHTGSA